MVDVEEMKNNDENYIPITVSVLKRFPGKLPFDIYVKRTKIDYTKIFRKKDILDWDRVDNYVGKGIVHFFVARAQYDSYQTLVQEIAQKYLGKDDSLSNREVALLTKEMIAITGAELIEKQKIDRQSVESAGSTVMGCIDMLEREPNTLMKIVWQMKDKIHMVKHSTIVSILSVILAKAVDIEAMTSLSNIGLGAFLHDIGIAQLSFDPEEKESYTPEEWKELKRHPELGKALLDEISGISTEVRLIILYHHEQPNGNGYPNGLRDQFIFLPAKIVSIADRFAELITKKSYRHAFSSDKALTLMEEDNGKFDRRLLESFRKIFT
ncbi:MAG: HD domain-containing protein [Bacteriovoracaceae bacterium]|nr:HD domain-containing protein [Bacteriovoracaceae bacterium]